MKTLKMCFINLDGENQYEQLKKQKNKIITQISKTKEKKEIFNAKYSIIFEENLISTPIISKFAQYIYVPLNLSEEELKQNLLHAAKTLQQEKHVNTVIILAYREDDILREGGYTAGRCIYIPNLTATFFDIAEVYYKNKKIYPAATEAIINKDNVNLYSKKHFKPEDVITKLKKGTEIMIIEHYRSFVTTDFIDIYKVLIWPHNKKRQYTGWIMDDNVINVIPNKNKNTK